MTTSDLPDDLDVMLAQMVGRGMLGDGQYNGEEYPLGDDHTPIELIDWATIHDHGDEIVPGLLIPGRWTALGAPAKQGKTTLIMAVTVEISEGRDPFDGNAMEPHVVLYVDAEMGRLDLEERLHELGRDPLKLERWHASDMPPRLDTIPGGNALLVTAQQLGASVVVIDGVNGTVTGAENDDTTWRAFFECSVMPLKRAGIAVWTGDNFGKDESLGLRGSSVKADKPDAVIKLKRTDNGVRLTSTHRRTSAYLTELLLSIEGVEGDDVITYRRTDTAWPKGTEAVAKLLDELDVVTAAGRGTARQALTDADRRVRNEVLAAAIRYRRIHERADPLELGEEF